MDPHFLLDIFTLCSVASLVVILILTKAFKRRRLALSHQTKSTQTENPVLNLDESINRLSTEMSTLQDRLDHLEQERLEAVTSHRMQLPLANNTEHCSEEPEHANHGPWSTGSLLGLALGQSIPPFEINPDVSSPYYRHNLFIFVIFM